jgi:hypothetical protein
MRRSESAPAMPGIGGMRGLQGSAAVRVANAIDFWRGFALVTIFINHIPGIYFDKFTHRSLSISDSADLFVFLAGWSLRLIVGRPEDPTPLQRVMFRLGGRILTLYAAQVVIVTIAIGMLASAAIVLENPLLLEWHNAAAVFYDPVHAHIGLMLLTHQLGYFDILPLYVVLMAMAPGIVLIHRLAPNALFPISLAIYLTVLVFRLSLPSWPGAGQWFFNPLAWQFIFVLGFLMARERGVGGFVRRHIGLIRLISVPIVLIAALVVLNRWWPDPTLMPEPKLLFILSKTYITPLRVIQFLALIALMSAAYPYIVRALPLAVDFLSKLGRNSLYVFCVGSVLSLAGQIVRLVYKGNILVDTMIVVVGIGLMGLAAWLSEKREGRS